MSRKVRRSVRFAVEDAGVIGDHHKGEEAMNLFGLSAGEKLASNADHHETRDAWSRHREDGV